jgi:hypothetical protein
MCHLNLAYHLNAKYSNTLVPWQLQHWLYTIFRNVEIFSFFFSNNKNLWGKYWIFKNIPFVKMKISHYLVNQQICVEGAKVQYYTYQDSTKKLISLISMVVIICETQLCADNYQTINYLWEISWCTNGLDTYNSWEA